MFVTESNITRKPSTNRALFRCTNSNECGKEAHCDLKKKPDPYCICVHTLEPLPPDKKCKLKIATGTPGVINVVVHPNIPALATTSMHSIEIESDTNLRVNSYLTNLTMAISGISISVLVIILGLALFWRFYYQKSTYKGTRFPMTRRGHHEMGHNLNTELYSTEGRSNMAVPLLSRAMITDLQKIGEGYFGTVYRGQLHFVKDNEEIVETIAVKILKQQSNKEAENDFVREVEIMSSFRHENVLSLTGFCPRDDDNAPWMVFEYMPFGDLATVLRNSNHQFWLSVPGLPRLSPESLISVSKQIADGMEYLANLRFVHRDLACRNCLVGSGLRVKISDFGMSRDVYTCDYYKSDGNRLLPIRWMSPESIVYGKFTLESDIWSYGVVLWEIYNYGIQPYFGYTNDEVLQFILDNRFLEIPQTCPAEVANVISSCWKINPKERISFAEVKEQFSELEKEIHYMEDSVRLPRPPSFTVLPHSSIVFESADGSNYINENIEGKAIDDVFDDDMNDDMDNKIGNCNVITEEIHDLLDLHHHGYVQPISTKLSATNPEYFQSLSTSSVGPVLE